MTNEDTPTGPPRPSSLALVLDKLHEAGLDPSEAEVYTHLSMHGGARAAALAGHLNWPRSKAYRVLEAMQSRGLVVATMDRPIEFRAVPPEELFRRLEDQQEATLAMVKDARGDVLPLLSDWYRSHSDGPGAITGSFTVLKGRQAVMRTLLDRLDERPQSVDLHLPVRHADAIPGGVEVVKAVEKAAGDECRVRLTVLTDSDWLRLEGTSRAEVADTQVPPFMVVDGTHLVASVPPRGVSQKAAQHFLWTDAAGIVLSYQALYEAIWASAKRAPRS